ncbi:MAG: FAD:protein FMN transferase [Myxococcales bacterium]|nr:FAD:protein FMN transferase [Myxococcales bacterium]
MSRAAAAVALLLALGCEASTPAGASAGPSASAKPNASEGPAAAEPHEAPGPGEAAPRRRGKVPVRKDGTVYADSELMGTHVSINVWVGDPSTADGDAAGAAVQAAFDEMARLEQIMSEWRPDSELSRLSDAAGGPPRPLSPELLEVLVAARRIAQDTGGAFDPTFHGVGQLWSFTPGSAPPTPQQVEAKLPLVGWERLELDEAAGTGRLRDPGMKLGLGAIGKGFAADEASALLVRQGLPNHVVEVGGDTYAAGTKGGQPWMVGIQSPQTRGVVGALPTRDRAVVTSGDYQRYFEYQGQRYAHILDPRTGWPVPAQRSPKSVTVVARTGTDADAYCTAVAVMGVDAGMAFVESREGLEAVIITQDDELRISSGRRRELVLPPSGPKP